MLSPCLPRLLLPCLISITLTLVVGSLFKELPFTFLSGSLYALPPILSRILITALLLILGIYISFINISWYQKVRLFIICLLPVALVIITGLLFTPYPSRLLTGIFILFIFLALWFFTFPLVKNAWNKLPPCDLALPSARTILFVFFCTAFFFGTGAYHLTQYAAVDEPLWTDGRIGDYWKNLTPNQWQKTAISDKPGITVALAAGAGLLFEAPKTYRETHFDFTKNNSSLSIENLYLAYRLPFLLFITMLLPCFFFFLRRLFDGPAAFVGYMFITLSPVLIGISKIINPDSLLWIFIPLTFLAYLTFLREKRFCFLVATGFFFGLALLTKYIANFLLLFLPLMFFLWIIFQGKKGPPLAEQLKQGLSHLLIILVLALTLFVLLLPASWVDPHILPNATLLSEASSSTALLFLAGVFFLGIDVLLSWKFTLPLILLLRKWRYQIVQLLVLALFGGLAFTLINTWTHFSSIDMLTILQSPKTSFEAASLFTVGMSNFYPLVFGTPPIVLLFTFIALCFGLQKKNESHKDDVRFFALWSIVAFILFFYLGSAVNDVALVNRYQIVIFPLLAILGGLGCSFLFGHYQNKFAFLSSQMSLLIIGVVIFLCSAFSLLTTTFPLSYSSSLLPLTYHADVKDMGAGSYEAATYLNSLPHARELTIWTDRGGVCKFFVGQCIDGLSFEKLKAYTFDYVVVSSARKNRTEKILDNPFRMANPHFIDFNIYYEKTNPDFFYPINNRPSQNIQVFPFTP